MDDKEVDDGTGMDDKEGDGGTGMDDKAGGSMWTAGAGTVERWR